MDQAKQFTQQATQSLQSGQFGQALELVDQAITLDPTDAEAHVLRGICLAQLSRPQEATAAFRRATEIAPTNPKAFYNLAVHQYMLGQKSEALSAANQALRLDPAHAGARDLASRMQGEIGGPATQQTPLQSPSPRQAEMAPPPGTGFTGAAMSPPSEIAGPLPQAPYLRSGYEQSFAHSLPFVANMGKLWVAIGWMLSALSLLAVVWGFVELWPQVQRLFENPDNPPTNFGSVGLNLLSYGNILAMLIWMILDLVDRKGNFLWLLPQILCGSCCGLGFVTLPVYLLAGRK